MKKIVLIMLLLVLLVSFTQARELKQHIIEINIDETGNGNVIERYLLDFSDGNELEAFREASKDNGASLLKWAVFDESIFSHIGKDEDIKNAIVSFEELGDTKFVRVSYELANVSINTSENSRATDWRLDERIFAKLESGGVYVIPERTIITIGLPTTTSIIGQIVPEAVTASNRWNWNGYLVSNQLKLEYKINKPIAEPIDAQGFLAELLQSSLFLIIGAVIVLAILVGLIKRKTLSEKIENYVVKKSKIETEEPEEFLFE